jgi:hypothetical protein
MPLYIHRLTPITDLSLVYKERGYQHWNICVRDLMLLTSSKLTSVPPATSLCAHLHPSASTVILIPSFLYTSLSSLLANVTGNNTYLSAATQSFQFMYSHLYSSSTGVVTDSIMADSCTQSAEAGGVSETAFFLEGAAVLGSITKNETLTDL